METSKLEETKKDFKTELEKLGVVVPEDEYEAAPRKLSPTLSRLCSFMAICFSAFQLYTATFGNFPDLVQRGIHLMFAFGLAFALYAPLPKHPKKDRIFTLDIILIIFTIITCGYVAYNYLWISENPGDSIGFDLWLGAIMILLVLEGGDEFLVLHCLSSGFCQYCTLISVYTYQECGNTEVFPCEVL